MWRWDKRNDFMKKAIIFITAFILVYVGMCYLVPGLRIKLDAEPMVYFIESIKSMVLVKSVTSFVAAMIAVIVSGRIKN